MRTWCLGPIQGVSVGRRALQPNEPRDRHEVVTNAADAALAQISHCLLVGFDVPWLHASVETKRTIRVLSSSKQPKIRRCAVKRVDRLRFARAP